MLSTEHVFVSCDFPFRFPQALSATQAPRGMNRIDRYEERWLLWIGWFRKYANRSRFVNFIRVNSSLSWQDELNVKRYLGEEGVCTLWRGGITRSGCNKMTVREESRQRCWLGWDFWEERGRSWRCVKGKKRRMRTCSILCVEDDTWHLDDIQRQQQQVYCSVKYNLK